MSGEAVHNFDWLIITGVPIIDVVDFNSISSFVSSELFDVICVGVCFSFILVIPYLAHQVYLDSLSYLSPKFIHCLHFRNLFVADVWSGHGHVVRHYETLAVVESELCSTNLCGEVSRCFIIV